MQTITPIRKLRPRRKTLAASAQQAGAFVTKMEISIERNGIITKHPLYFDAEPLPLDEMYDNGFLGDIEFDHPGGLVEKAELEAGPVGQFDGDIVGKFVFKITNPRTNQPFGAKVVKFNFYKK